MAKKSKKKTDSAKPESKAPREAEGKNLDTKSKQEEAAPTRNGKERPLIRAIRVTAEVLEAAKAYRKAKGVSFYQLGLESISERLTREGFLRKANQ